MIELHDALSALRRVRRDDDVVIATMSAAKAWMELGKHPLDMIFVPSSMGHASSFGLGIALAQPERRVIVCNGDGSMLMNLGSLVTIATQGPGNLVVIVLNNGVYEVTGAQPTPDEGGADFAAIARGCGFESVFHFSTLEKWTRNLEPVLGARGPVFVLLEITPVVGRAGPKSPGNAAERARALMRALGSER
jgi:sulfopyruvate decarboxylase subunit beta